MAIKKMLILQRVVKRFVYQTIIIQCSKPSFPSLENGSDGVRENISFPVSFCVSNLVSSNNLLIHRRYWRNFSLKPLSVRAREIWRIPLRQRTYMWFLRLNFCVLLRRLVIWNKQKKCEYSTLSNIQRWVINQKTKFNFNDCETNETIIIAAVDHVECG